MVPRCAVTNASREQVSAKANTHGTQVETKDERCEGCRHDVARMTYNSEVACEEWQSWTVVG